MKCELHFSFTISREGRSTKMSDWSSSTAKRFRDRQRQEQDRLEHEKEQQLVRDKKALLDAEILKRNAPSKWDKLCDTFATRCTEFNAEGTGTKLTATRRDDNTLDVVRDSDPPIKTTFVFDPQRYVIKVRGLFTSANAQSSQIEIKPNDGSELGFFNSKDSTLITAEQIAEHCLQNLLGLG
jgi:hypothetical protein